MAHRVMVVEDEPENRLFIGLMLRTEGYDIVEAEDGRDALDKVATEEPDLILSDWNMPNMSGLELTRYFRSRDDAKNIPMLIVTTRSVKEDIMAAVQAGANNYVVKPFTPQVLKDKIDSVLSTKASAH